MVSSTVQYPVGVASVNGPPPRQRRPRREEVRARILVAAASVFVERGFAGASVDQIAAAAGLTKGAVYSNFASKDDLFFALMDQQVAARATLARLLVADAGTRHDAIRAVGRRLTGAAVANRDWQLLFFEYWLRAMRDPVVRERFAIHRRELRRLITGEVSTLLDASVTGGSSSAASDIALLLLAMSNGVAIEELLDPGSVPADFMGDVLDAYAGRIRARVREGGHQGGR
jgi:AcrR family transcriptional regulator